MFKKRKNQVHYTLWLLLYKKVKKQLNNKKKEIGELNFGINYTLQQTNAMLKILNVEINVSLKHTVYTSSLP